MFKKLRHALNWPRKTLRRKSTLLMLEALERRELMTVDNVMFPNSLANQNMQVAASDFPALQSKPLVVTSTANAAQGSRPLDVPKLAPPLSGQNGQNGLTVHSSRQHVTSDVRVPFSVATLNAQMRPTDASEVVPGGINALGNLIKPGFLDAILDKKSPETPADSTERVGMVLRDYSKYDIVALQEVFDPDQVGEVAQGANRLGFEHLRGAGKPCSGAWIFKTCYGLNSGLSLLVDRDLASQSDFDHRQAVFGKETLDWEKFANKGFTLDKVRIDPKNPDHFVYVVNTHLHAESSSVRHGQILELAVFVDNNTDGRHPVIFLGDFNVSNDPAISGTEYSHLISALRAYDPFQHYEELEGVEFNTADATRNAYRRFGNRKTPSEMMSNYNPDRIDYILIRQGSEYGVQVDGLRLEDGTGSRVENKETQLFQQWRRQYPELFGPDELVAFPSDHFGLSADLVLVKGDANPTVKHSTRTFYALAQSVYNTPWTDHVIDLEFGSAVNVASVRDEVRLLRPDGAPVPDIVVRPVWDDPLHGRMREWGEDSLGFMQPQTLPDPRFSQGFPGSGSELCMKECPQPIPSAQQPNHKVENLLRRRVGEYTDRFQIIFKPHGYGDYELRVGPAITDRYGHEMDQDRDGRQGFGDDEYVAKVDIYNPNWTVTDMASGDVDGDGADELFTAFADQHGNAWIMRTDDNNRVVTQIYHDGGAHWSIQALAAGDTDGNGRDELYVGFMSKDGSAYIYRSDTGKGVGNPIYVSSTPGLVKVQDLALGDTDGNGRDELYSAFQSLVVEARIYRSETGSDLGSPIYSSGLLHWSTVQSLATGDADDDGRDELYSALKPGNGAPSIYRSATGRSLGDLIHVTPDRYWDVRGIEIGDIDGDRRNELYTVFSHATLGSFMYLSGTGANIGTRIYESHSGATWSAQAFSLADVDGDGNDEMFAAFAAFDQADRAAIFRCDTGYLDPTWANRRSPLFGVQRARSVFA